MKKIMFKRKNGNTLVGVLHSTDSQTNKIVIIVHGFAIHKDKQRYLDLADAFVKRGIDAFRVDLGGAGESEGEKITVSGWTNDLQSAIKLMKQRGYEKVGIIGHSLGGLVALNAYSNDVNSLVLWTPVSKAKDKRTEILPEEQVSLRKKGYHLLYKPKDNKIFTIPEKYYEEREAVNRKQLFSNLNIPILILHGTSDETILFADSEEAIKLSPKGSELVLVDGAIHDMNDHMDTIIPKTVDWMVSNLV